MRKIGLFVLAIVFMLLFASCKTTENVEPVQEVKVAPATIEEPKAEEPVVEEKTDIPAKGYLTIDLIKGIVPGVLYQLNMSEGQEPVVRAVALGGNQAGNKINEREPSIDNIRFVFELSEWVEVRVDSDVKDSLMLFAVPHNSDPAVYDDSYFEAIPDNMTYVGLNAPEGDDPNWGSFYLSTDFSKAGFYDLVFTDGIRPVAMILTRFYEEGTIRDISDEQLESFMSQAAEDAKKL